MELSRVKVSFIKEGLNGGEFARFEMFECELPPEGRTLIINSVRGDVVSVEHDMSNKTAKVWID